MLIVIQCAASKKPDAGYLRTTDGQRVLFVADPKKCESSSIKLAKPDDPSDRGFTWRQMLIEYNEGQNENPLGLLPAYHLYRNGAYEALVDRLGADNVFILSAGWGLIRTDFLTPQYDITFSGSAEPYKRRRKGDVYGDLCQLPEGNGDPVVFFGGKDYLPLFCDLSKRIEGRRVIFYNSKNMPQAPGCELIRYKTTTRTNWHYQCVNSFLAGEISID